MKQLPPNSDNFYIDHDKKADTFTVKKENVELLGKNPLHPRTRLTRKNKKDDVVFLGKNGLYPWEWLACKITNIKPKIFKQKEKTKRDKLLASMNKTSSKK